jgi:hypothetical protein
VFSVRFLIIESKDTYIPLWILEQRKMSETDSAENGRTDMTTVKVPKALMERVEAILKVKGYVSRSEYVRTAIQKQLASDEVRT